MRRIIQIAATGTAVKPDIIYALCDDGSLWKLRDDRDRRWERMPTIPQHDTDA